MPEEKYPRRTSAGYPYTRNKPQDEGASASGSDPLAELARLIGQSDPFAELRRAAPPPRRDNNGWPASEPPWRGNVNPALRRAADPGRPFPSLRNTDFDPPPASDRRLDDFAPPTVPDYRHEEDRHFADPQPRYGHQEHQPGRDGEPAYYADEHAQEHPHDDPFAPMDYGEAEPAPRARRRGGVVTVIAILGLAVVGTAGAYGYRTIFRSGPAVPPLIRADAGPNKIVPSGDSSGKQIYDRIGADSGQGEKVVSREERPVDFNTPTAVQTIPAAASPTATSGVPPTVGGWPAPPGTLPAVPAGAAMPPAAAPQAPAAAPGGTQSEPRKVRTVTIRADQGASSAPAAMGAMPTARPTPSVDSSPPNPPPAPAPTPVRPQAARAAAPAAAPVSGGSGPLSITPRASSTYAEPQAAPPVRSAAVTPAPRAAAASAGASGYVVQLSAQKSQDEAASAFRAAQAKYPGVLGGKPMLIRKKEIPGKGTFFGSQVGPFAGREEAVQLCEQLKSAGGNCIVQHN